MTDDDDLPEPFTAADLLRTACVIELRAQAATVRRRMRRDRLAFLREIACARRRGLDSVPVCDT